MIELIKRHIERHLERRQRTARYGELRSGLSWALDNLNAAIGTAAMLQAHKEDRELCATMQAKAEQVRNNLEAVIEYFENQTETTPVFVLGRGEVAES